MRIPGYKAAISTLRWLRSRVFPGAIILGYHRVVKSDPDVFQSCISPDHFDQHMEVLSRYAHPISLDELLTRLEAGAPVSKTVSVTLDDGYFETLSSAKPILEKHGIPGTAFITTGSLGAGFWWDEIEGLLLGASPRPDELRLTVDSSEFRWKLSSDSPIERQKIILSIADFLRSLEPDARQEALARIRVWLDRPGDTTQGDARALRPDEIVELVRDQLITVGSHSVSHRPLKDLPREKQEFELRTSKLTLEEITGRPVSGFSYPHGSWSPALQELVRETGFQYACSSHNDVTWRGSDPFALPRFWPLDWDGDRFARLLRFWLGR